MNNFSKINLISGFNGSGKSTFIINVVSRAIEINNECYYISSDYICKKMKLPRIDTDKEIYQQLTIHLTEIFPNYSTCSISTKHYVKQIIFLGLTAKPNSIIILEYPEVFLHPVSQIKLTEFLINIAKNNVYVFIETNSAYILNALRIAVFKKQLLTDDVNIIFLKNIEYMSTVPPLYDYNKGFIDQLTLLPYYGFLDYDLNNNSIVRVKISNNGKLYNTDDTKKCKLPKHFLGIDFTNQMSELF